jgi:hypothetical protein
MRARRRTRPHFLGAWGREALHLRAKPRAPTWSPTPPEKHEVERNGGREGPRSHRPAISDQSTVPMSRILLDAHERGR